MLTRLLLAAVAIIVVGAAAAVVVLPRLDEGAADTAVAAETPLIPVATAPVIQRTMEVTEEFDGTLGYAGEGVIISRPQRHVHEAARRRRHPHASATRSTRSTASRSSYLMYGNRPAWRRLDDRQQQRCRTSSSSRRACSEIGVLSKEQARPRLASSKGKTRECRPSAGRRRTGQDQQRSSSTRGEVTFLPERRPRDRGHPGARLRPASGRHRCSPARAGHELVVTLDLEADRRDILSGRRCGQRGAARR